MPGSPGPLTPKPTPTLTLGDGDLSEPRVPRGLDLEARSPRTLLGSPLRARRAATRGRDGGGAAASRLRPPRRQGRGP